MTRRDGLGKLAHDHPNYMLQGKTRPGRLAVWVACKETRAWNGGLGHGEGGLHGRDMTLFFPVWIPSSGTFVPLLDEALENLDNCGRGVSLCHLEE